MSTSYYKQLLCLEIKWTTIIISWSRNPQNHYKFLVIFTCVISRINDWHVTLSQYLFEMAVFWFRVDTSFFSI